MDKNTFWVLVVVFLHSFPRWPHPNLSVLICSPCSPSWSDTRTNSSRWSSGPSPLWHCGRDLDSLFTLIAATAKQMLWGFSGQAFVAAQRLSELFVLRYFMIKMMAVTDPASYITVSPAGLWPPSPVRASGTHRANGGWKKKLVVRAEAPCGHITCLPVFVDHTVERDSGDASSAGGTHFFAFVFFTL